MRRRPPLRRALSADIWPEGYDRVVLGEVDSTMAEARRRVSQGVKRPTWILARHQSAARGRLGRRWESLDDNFAATLILRPEGTIAAAALRSFLAANALFEAMAMHVDRDTLSLKWPNDVLLNHGKVAGILLESAGGRDRIDWLAIGIGVNLRRKPKGVRDAAFPPVSVLDETGVSISPEDLLNTLADCYATEERILERLGFQPIRERWLERAARVGEVITARTPREEIVGRFETVDEAGQLVLSTARGTVKVPAADIFF